MAGEQSGVAGSKRPGLNVLAFAVWGPLAAILLFSFLGELSLFQRLEWTTVNARVELRHTLQPGRKASNELLLVAIDDNSLQEMEEGGAGRWPWTRAVHGDFTQLLSLLPPTVVTWDFLFTESDKPESDKAFADGIRASEVATITGSVAGDGAPPLDLAAWPVCLMPLASVKGDITRLPPSTGVLLPVPKLRMVSKIGFVNSDADLDGIRRELPMVVRVGDMLYPSLVLQSLIQHWHVRPDQIRVVLGDVIEVDHGKEMRRIPIDAQGKMRLNYRYEAENVQNVSYARLLRSLVNLNDGKPWEAAVPDPSGKAIMVGQVSTGLSDIGPSPLNPKSPLVLVHFNALNNILENDFLHVVPAVWIWLGWWLVSVGCLIAMGRLSFVGSVTLSAVVLLGYIGIACALFVGKSIELPIFAPVGAFFLLQAGWIGSRVVVEQRARRQMKKMFAAYVTPGVLQQITAKQATLKLGGERKSGAVLFSDIRGFTSLSETMGEEELVRQLNEYLTAMVDCVNRRDGSLHKFIGDAILAVWGDMVSDGPKQDCTASVHAALDMRKELVVLNRRWKAEGRPELKIGVGINFGPMIMGNIGALQRMEFTVIGDAVNVASRLEGATKNFGIDLLLGEPVAELVKEEFLLRTAGLLKVKGREQPVRVYYAIRSLAEASPEEIARTGRYEKAFARHLAREFAVAEGEFEALAREDASDTLSAVYAGACREYQKTPPEKQWTGVWVLKEK
jgi:adenylate cyclase